MSGDTLPIYDAVPYVDDPIRAAHPAHLATTAYFLGFDALPPESARVLELGCAHGGNLIPLAAEFPKGKFIGIDLSKRQIEGGLQFISELGLSNIELKHMSIMDVGESLGEFDYIICHGILSWVPKEIQEKIFSIFSTNLSPNGLAYVSYNTFPGWHVRTTLRELMLFECESIQDPGEKAREARRTLEYFSKVFGESTTKFALAVREEITPMLSMPDWYFTHDFVSDHNTPFYFKEIAKIASRFRLSYVGDSELPSMMPHHAAPGIQKLAASRISNIIELEHLLDTAKNRMFRRSIFTKRNFTPKIEIPPHKLRSCYLSTLLKTDSSLKAGSADKIRFSHPNSGAVETHDPVLIKILEQLSNAWPESVRYEDLISSSHVTFPDERQEHFILEYLSKCHLANLIEASLLSLSCTNQISDYSKTTPLVRHQLKRGNRVTNLRHEAIDLDPIDVKVVSLLDGTRTIEEIYTKIRAEVQPIVVEGTFSNLDSFHLYLKGLASKSLILSQA